MSQRTDSLRTQLDSLFEISLGNEGKVLIAPTKKDRDEVLKAVEELPDKMLLTEFAVVSGQLVSGILTQMGKRPADYWRDEELAKSFAKRIAKALQLESDTFTSAFQVALKGGG